ncbi:MAG TPA: flavoprotein [Propionibacteriaceae bacterium]
MDNQRPSRVCTLFATATWVCRSATAHNVDTDRRGPRLETLTGLPVRSTPRLPHEPQPHPKSDVLVGTPMTAKSVAKLALGIADNQALTVLCECVATVPMIIFPRVNAAHARQPAWNDHLDRLRTVGVELIHGEHVWPLAAGTAGPRELPWAAILSALKPFV